MQCLAKIWTYYLSDDKQMRYVLSHGRSLYLSFK